MQLSKIFCVISLLLYTLCFNAHAQENYGITEKSPENYLYKCKMNDEQTFYYVMPNDDVLIYDIGNEFKTVGTKVLPPYGWTNFKFMIKLADITYAVDQDGFIWQQKYPFREVVGQATQRKEE